MNADFNNEQAEVATVKFLVSMLSVQKLDSHGEAIEPDPGEFAAAIQAIDRAAAARANQAERRTSVGDRRKGSPDPRPDGSPDRRSGLDRRAAPSQKFGRRGKSD